MKQIEIKFIVGDDIWFMHDNQVVCGTVDTVTLRKAGQRNRSRVEFTVSDIAKVREVYHDSSFTTKQELLESL